MNKEADRVLVGRNAEIDTRVPFRSVKEAVTLFGEKVLTGELYSDKLSEDSRLDGVSAELEETRQELKKVRAESMVMANWLSSLQTELERAKQELQQCKQRETEKRPMEPEIVDVKFVKDNSRKFEKKSSRYVTFANPSSEVHLIIPQRVQRLDRHISVNRKKKKPLIPLLGGIFSRNTGIQEVA